MVHPALWVHVQGDLERVTDDGSVRVQFFSKACHVWKQRFVDVPVPPTLARLVLFFWRGGGRRVIKLSKTKKVSCETQWRIPRVSIITAL